MKITFLENRMIYKGVSGTKPSVEAPAAATVVAPVAPAAAPAPAPAPAPAKTDGGAKTETIDTTSATLAAAEAQRQAEEARVERLDAVSKARKYFMDGLKDITPDAKKSLYLTLASLLNGTSVEFNNTDPSKFENSKAEAVSFLTPRVLAKSEQIDATVAGIVNAAGNAKQIAQTFVDEVFAQIQSKYEAEPTLKSDVDSIVAQGKSAKYGIDVSYDPTADVIVATPSKPVAQSDVADILDNDKLSPQEEQAGIAELSGGRGKIVMIILGFLGLVNKDELDNPLTKDKAIKKIVNGDDYVSTLVCGLCGLEFGKKQLNKTIEVMPEGSMKEGLKQLVSKTTEQVGKLTENGGDKIPLKDLGEIVGISEDGKTAKPFEKAASVVANIDVYPDRPLMINVPQGSQVKLVDGGGVRIATVYENLSPLRLDLPSNGVFTAVDKNYVLRLDPKTVLGTGSIFSKNTALWKGALVAGAEASAAVPSDASSVAPNDPAVVPAAASVPKGPTVTKMDVSS